MNNYIKHILVLFTVAAVAYSGHHLISSKLGVIDQWSKTGYTLMNLYLLGFFTSLVVVILILTIHRTMPKNLGIVFLGAITLKVLVFYIYISKGLNQFDNKFLEYNFIIVFFVFLICDVFVAFRALNEGMRNE